MYKHGNLVSLIGLLKGEWMRLSVGMEMTQIQLHQSNIHVASHEGWKSEAHCLICKLFTRLESVCSDS